MPLRLPFRLSILCLSAMLALAPAPQARAADDLTPAQAQAIDGRIHDYILAHPDVVVQALQKAQAMADAQHASDARVALHDRQSQLLHDVHSPVMGNAEGTVTLVEFFDYRCPYCKLDAPNVAALIAQNPKLRVVMKEFPILGPDSVVASRVALVAAKHGKYSAFHNAMFAAKPPIDEKKVMEVARTIGLDLAKTRQEMDDPDITDQIQANLDLAKALGVDGTPAFIAGDTVLPGAVSTKDLQQLVDTARKG